MTKSSLKHCLFPLLVYLLVIWVYSGSFTVPFIFDDLSSIPQNPHIRQLWPLSQAMVALPGSTVAGRPLVSFTLALNYQISGLNPWSYHLFNLLIHLFNLTLISWLVQRTWNLYHHRRQPFIAVTHATSTLAHSSDSPVGWYLGWTIALLWAVHPLNTEAVVYVVQRTELLVSFFLLLTLVCANQGWHRQSIEMSQDSSDPDAAVSASSDTSSADTVSFPRTSNQSWVWYSLSVFSCVLGMLTKEVMAVAVILVYLYDAIFASQSFTGPWRRHKKLYIPLACTWIIFAYLLATQPRGGTVGYAHGTNSWNYLLTQSQVLTQYLVQIFSPTDLSIYYDFPLRTSLAQVLPTMVLWTLLLAVSVWGLVKKHIWSFFAVSFFLILAPTSSFIPVLTEFAADRRMYLPSLAVIVLITSSVFVLIQRFSTRPFTVDCSVSPASSSRLYLLVITFFLVISFSLAARSSQRLADYRTELSIWQAALRNQPQSAMIHNLLGLVYESHRADDRALNAYRQAAQLNSSYADGAFNYGRFLLDQNDFSQAKQWFEEAIRRFPKHHKAMLGLARLSIEQHDLEQAQKQLDLAYVIKSDDPDVHTVQGIIYQQQNRLDLAAQSFAKAIYLNENFSEAILKLAQLFESQNQLSQAMALYQHMIESSMSNPAAHHGLGLLFLKMYQPADAAPHFRAAGQARPNWAPPQLRLAWALAVNPSSGPLEFIEARQSALRALALTHEQDPAAYDALAAVYARLGDFSAAVAAAEKAIALLDQAQPPASSQSVKHRLALYQQKQIYVLTKAMQSPAFTPKIPSDK